MKVEHLLHSLDPTWHSAFLHFVETGEASPEFLAYLDHDESCQRAVDAAFGAQAEAFENFSIALKTSESAEQVETKAAAMAMAVMLEDIIDLPAPRRAEAVKKAAETVTSEKPERVEELVEIAHNLEVGAGR